MIVPWMVCCGGVHVLTYDPAHGRARLDVESNRIDHTRDPSASLRISIFSSAAAENNPRFGKTAKPANASPPAFTNSRRDWLIT